MCGFVERDLSYSEAGEVGGDMEGEDGVVDCLEHGGDEGLHCGVGGGDEDA